MKFNIIACLIFIVAFWFQRQRDNDINDILGNGITEKVIIADKTKDCVSATRNTNRATVRTKSMHLYNISIPYRDCINLNKGDSIIIRHIETKNEVVRAYNFEVPVKNKNYLQWVLLCLSFLFLGGAIYDYRNKTF